MWETVLGNFKANWNAAYSGFIYRQFLNFIFVFYLQKPFIFQRVMVPIGDL